MIAGTLAAIAIILGYVVAVSFLMAATFGITKVAPGFVVRNHLLKNSYKLVQDLVWLLCVAAGAFVAAFVASSTAHAWFVELLLATGLVCVPWTSAWDVRQRGVVHQILMSAVTVVGVAAGFAFWKR